MGRAVLSRVVVRRVDAVVVVAPQNARGGCHNPTDVDAFLRWAANRYGVDQSRIYLTGLSCGAIGTWEYLRTVGANALPAAVVPICGNGIDAWNQRGCLLGNMPMWAFHGDADGTIPVQCALCHRRACTSCIPIPCSDLPPENPLTRCTPRSQGPASGVRYCR